MFGGSFCLVLDFYAEVNFLETFVNMLIKKCSVSILNMFLNLAHLDKFDPYGEVGI